MEKFNGLMTSLSPHWATPKALYAELDKEFYFDFDPCPLNADFNGLSVAWGKRNYVNPPYGRKIINWVHGAWQRHFDTNCLVVMLLPSRTDTKWFHEFIINDAKEIRFIKGRLKFNESKNSAPFPSMIVIYE